MQCPDCGFKGIRAEFTYYSKEKGWNHFMCPQCGKPGDKTIFTPKKKDEP